MKINKYKISVIIAILAIAALSGCTGQTVEKTTEPGQVSPLDDEVFHKTVKEASAIMIANIDLGSGALKWHEYTTYQDYAKQTEGDATKYIQILDNLTVSAQNQDMYTEFHLYLESIRDAAIAEQQAVNFIQKDDVDNYVSSMKTAADHLEKANNHIKRATAYLKS